MVCTMDYYHIFQSLDLTNDYYVEMEDFGSGNINNFYFYIYFVFIYLFIYLFSYKMYKENKLYRSPYCDLLRPPVFMLL